MCSKLLGTHLSATLILLSSEINQRVLKSIFEALGGLRLSESDQKELVAFLRRWSRASYKRNRIVHGYWMLDIEVIPEQGGGYRTKAEWYDSTNLPTPHSRTRFSASKTQRFGQSTCSPCLKSPVRLLT